MLQFVTVQLVVRSALLNGGTLGGKAIEALYLVSAYAAHVHSSFITSPPAPTRELQKVRVLRPSVRTIHPVYGVALCYKAC
jgi:hypothetical protein|mmetsp:Transcript_9647/g.17545  ORF Transcript_9647/g.17545 Transcript_9647/m.17545 type:complete len:81 (-) Transcript_9647:1148-1390(-)